MAEPVLADFDFAAQPGGDWPAIAGAPTGESPPSGDGGTATVRSGTYTQVYLWGVS